MAASGGIIVNCINTIHRFGTTSGIFPGVLSQVRHYAARKGTREKARKKKVKVEIKKLNFEQKLKLSKKVKIIKPDTLLYPEGQPDPIDDVYFQKYYKLKAYPFAESIQCHREYFHPTMYNVPDSIVEVFLELNMEGIKKTRVVDPFSRIVSIKHTFDQGIEKNILVFSKEPEHIQLALESGAALAGGAEIVKQVLSGELSLHNYDTVIAHPSAMPDVLTLRGLLKRKLPTFKTGTLGTDIKQMIYTQLHGIQYQVKAYDHFKQYGYANIPIGKLNMEIDHLEDNMKSIVDSVMSAKPRRPGSFITRIRICCPPSPEQFKIDESLYLPKEEPEDIIDEAEEDDQYAVPLSV